MSVVNTLSRAGHFEEFNSPLVTAEGVLTPDARKLRALRNLQSVTAGNGTITTAATTTALNQRDASGKRSTILTLTAFTIDTGGDNAALGIGAKFWTFPAGDIYFYNAEMFGTFLDSTSAGYTNVLDAGIGSVIASGAVSVLGGTATFEDTIGGTTTAVLPAATVAAGTGLAAAAGISNRVIASSAVHDLFLNVAGTWTNVTTAGAIKFTGTIIVNWRPLS